MYRRVLLYTILNSFHLNGDTVGFRPQIQQWEPHNLYDPIILLFDSKHEKICK